MNRTLKEATVSRYYYQTHLQIREHLYQFLMAYNFAKRRKTLAGLTPYEHILKCWQRKVEMSYSRPSRKVRFGSGSGEFRFSTTPLGTYGLRASAPQYWQRPVQVASKHWSSRRVSGRVHLSFTRPPLLL
jgi:hypothetical protein